MRRFSKVLRRTIYGGVAGVLVLAGIASASDVAVAVVDTTAPTGAVTVTAGSPASSITINLSVTGNQAGTATFQVYRDWTLSGGTFTGSNAQQFTVAPRAGGDPATTFTTTGSVAAAAGQGGGTFTLAVAAFNITNSNATGAKLTAGSSSTYQVTVQAPADSTAPVITKTVTGTSGSNGWYTSNVSVAWTVTDAQSTVVIDSGCGTQNFTTEGASTSSCTAHSAGGSASDSVALKIDKSSPSATWSAEGTLGDNGWYTSPVTIKTNGGDTISDPTTCSDDQTQSTNTTGTTFNGSCTNDAGLTQNAAPLTVKVDMSAPSVNLVVSGTEGANGWYTSNVTVTANGTDATSGASCDSPVTLNSETGGTLVSLSCTNGAGLSTTKSVTVKIDKTNPTASLSPSGTLGSNGWYTSAVTITTNGADTVSDPTTCTDEQTQSTDTTGTTFNGSCTNDAGLTQNATPLTVKVDRTAPSIDLVVTGTEGTNGWYTSNVTVSAHGVDAISGVTCDDAVTLTNETSGTQVKLKCTNGAGLSAEDAVTIKIDKSAPTAVLEVTAGHLGTNGWYTSDVTLETSGTDSMSEPVVCTASQQQTTDTTATTFNGSCTNDAGLTTNATAVTVKLDKTAPDTPTFTGGPADNASYYFGDVPAAPSCASSDATSGLDSCVVSGYSSAVGPQTLTATATDNAGNTSMATRHYAVMAWRLSGFYAPVDMDHDTTYVLNTVKGGSTVPLKFEVFAASELTQTASVQQPLKVTKVTCLSAAVLDTVDMTATGATSLRYDTTAGQFIFNWQTPKAAGSCYDATVTTIDGSSITAHFKLK